MLHYYFNNQVLFILISKYSPTILFMNQRFIIFIIFLLFKYFGRYNLSFDTKVKVEIIIFIFFLNPNISMFHITKYKDFIILLFYLPPFIQLNFIFIFINIQRYSGSISNTFERPMYQLRRFSLGAILEIQVFHFLLIKHYLLHNLFYLLYNYIIILPILSLFYSSYLIFPFTLPPFI